jgi:multidrug resistance efflux pump
MKAYIQDMGELTDSRELLESRPQPFISIFTYTLIALLLTAVIWSFLGEIDENIKAQGIVRPNQKIGSIRNQVAGKVESVNLKEGDYVKKGALLFTIEHSILDLQRDALAAECDKSTQELVYLDKFKKSILDGRNYFDSTLEGERDYYNKFIKYQTDMEVQSKQVELNSSTLNEVKKELAGLNMLKQSVLQEKNLFVGNDNIYYNQYIDYSLNLRNLKDLQQQKKELYDSSLELASAGAISSKELDDLKKQSDAAEINLQKYQNEFLLNINSKIEENDEKLKQLLINLKTSGENTNATFNVSELPLQKYKLDTIVQIESDIKVLQTNLEKQRSDLEAVKTNIENCKVTSPIDGYINLSNEINTGDLLQSGTEIATIVPEDGTVYKVQLYVSNADIANIKVGQKIKYHFPALPYKEYGELKGAITNIGTDARINQTNGSSYYSVEASVENKPLSSYKGVKAEIKVGMDCEAQVITKTKKILYYFLEKINLRD